ncbi:MAG TPA: hypothetical protein VH350_05455 [Candidatus Sulfotelmatobacter sp.]|jgi:hypothetical protein|nr:hypothetical protein [Candidatus Sulfotelmatobacter sp.]
MAKAQLSQIPVQTLEQALMALCGSLKTQSGQHIKPFHTHCSNRLVVEGGFPPEWLRPCPPLTSKPGANNKYGLSYSKAAENPSEQSVLGAMKYKNVDVTVVIPGIGPALGISAKSTGNAFRNLTNRMEEAPGDCVNIHMMYPGFVFGFLHLIKFAKATEVTSPNDASFDAQGKPLNSVVRYHNALSALTGRTTITDPAMRYESVGLLVYRCVEGRAEVFPTYPAPESPVHFSRFFQKLYDIYDLRYAYPDSTGRNHRKTWTVPNETWAGKFDAETGCSWEPRLSVGDDDLNS